MVADLLLDANVFMYAAGGEHPYRDSCRSVIRALARDDGRLGDRVACIDTELLQEVAYRYVSIGKAAVGRDLQASILRLDLPFLPVDEPAARTFLDLQRTHAPDLDRRQVSVRDLRRLAVMVRHGIPAILTADRDFDRFPGIERTDPREVTPAS